MNFNLVVFLLTFYQLSLAENLIPNSHPSRRFEIG